MRLILGRFQLTQKQMSSGFVQLVAFGKIEDDILGVLQAVLEVDEVEHEIADGVEDDVLGQDLGNSHRLIFLSFLLAVTSFGFVSAPERSFDGLAKIVEVAHQVTGRFDELLFVFLNPIVIILYPASILFLLHSLLEFLVKNLLKHTLPDVLFLPDSVIVHKFRQILFLESFALLSRHFGDFIQRILLLEVNKLTRIEDRVNHLKIDVFFMNYGGKKIFDELAEGLQAFEAHDASRLADHLEDLGYFHASIFFVEGQNEFTELLFGRHNLILLLICDLFVVNDILKSLVEFLLGLFHIHHLLHGVVRLLLQFLRLLCEEFLVALQIV